jgi:nucleoside 2-deoxyribosyltransferase
MKKQIRTTDAACHSHREIRPLSIYFAGELWNHKDLIGNEILASYIEKCSQERYRCVVPQNLEQATNRAVQIRNQDLKQVMVCDLCLFNFDGTELDSGTVVEFMFAKLLDIPCVILRSDFRSSGDANKDGDPWNLMVSNWPRARVLKLHAMAEYQSAFRATGGDLSASTESLYTRIASLVIENFDAVMHEHALASRRVLEPVYDWAMKFPGGGLRRAVRRRRAAQTRRRQESQGLAVKG